MNRTLLLLSLALLIGNITAADASDHYESKIQAALDTYAAHSEEILQRALQEGSSAIGAMEIDANGDLITSFSSSATAYVEFGLKAVNEELDKIEKSNKQEIDAHAEYDEVFSALASQNDDGKYNPTITYTQLKKFEDIDGEFRTLWEKATGEVPPDGHMTLSQFVIFNDLWDKLLMAKVDFTSLTKGKKGKIGISYDKLYNWPGLSEEMTDREFDRLWKEALGGEAKKVDREVMNYEQFLVFHEIAGDWLQNDMNDIIKEARELRWDDYYFSGDSTDDSDDDEDDDGYYGLPSERWKKFWIKDEDLPEDLKADLESDDEDIRAEAIERRRIDPERWAEFSYWELHSYFACEKAMASPRQIWTDEQWRDMREFYHEFVEEDKKDGKVNEGQVRSYQFSTDEYDLTQNAIPFQTVDRGRGLKAVREIKAGELVFKATNNTIVFNRGHTWRKFLFAVNERFADPGITCDIFVWSWVQDLVDGGPLKVVMDLDTGSLLNEGRDELWGWDPPNVQCGKPDATRCDMDYYAFRDIKEGDELLINYEEFAFLDSWPEMGL